MKLKRKVRLEDGTDGSDIFEVLACPSQMFEAVGMPFMMYKGLIPRRPNIVVEVAGAAGVAALGATILNTDLNALEQDKIQENLNQLAWETRTRPFP
ncbi:hypothetical protein SARC_00803 [Sphaeroforma arctica JP610]|uniref:Uncharacterized protein n=1 Tax=Sphaeroforma arctica JP610 TaxID=667725 RepID=A0A0L0GDV3_9EUKA|nr:hypothetical protein SARC_00803 [Sphaeroforma arctica JP610]KNC87059.1 hypothetical protein SARC_00803 [Sphaeroforma arctica JP610]|eukprot:XP_014160961.1 hypothetical protein SARC_00803 [Sphaeroforma arctica JP610]